MISISNSFKPKIRIIHLYAPEIIKTDVANFRELVQRLTGKPEGEEEEGGGRRRGRKRMMMTPPIESKFDPLMEFHYPKKRMIMEEEEAKDYDDGEIWVRSKEKFINGGFCDGFSELDGFMEELSATMPVIWLQLVPVLG
ncbi:VQ motif-containing protein 25-like [Senna tora]|uniref:VQ motif-containing protein 25-like n=1 Tax=Senna tora TaxID=362788 RepID=A0A834TNZ3_9FABA|nr:VQ motif-containing protein 25-like [Senna tora]